MNSDIAKESVSETMLDLLSKLSHKLDKTLPAIHIGSIITAALYNHPTSLQIDLGIVIRNSKKLINLKHVFKIRFVAGSPALYSRIYFV